VACASDRPAWRPIGLFDLAIETGLALRLVLHLPLRQTEGALRSIADLLGVEIRIPDHTTFSRRGGGLMILPERVERNEPRHLLVDSAGIKIYGEGEWLDQKHGVRSCRRWRKISSCGRRDTNEIAAVEFDPGRCRDVSAVADLLDQIEGPVGSMTAMAPMTAKWFTMRWQNAIPRPLSLSRLDRRPFRARVAHSATSILGDRKQGRIGWQRSSDYLPAEPR